MPNFDITIDRTGMDPSTGLVLSGVRQAGWCLMPGWQLPAQIAQTRYVTSDVLHGDTPVSSTWLHTAMSGDVLLEAEDAGERAAAIAELQEALGRVTFAATVNWNGDESVWRCDRGSMTPSAMDYLSVAREQPVYTLTIPCYPLPI